MALSTDVATLAAACRRGLANGSSLTGDELRLCIDTLETLANTTESKAATAVAALEALLVTHIDTNWVAVGTANSAAVRSTAIAALATPRTAAVAAAAASVTNITVNDSTDGRAA